MFDWSSIIPSVLSAVSAIVVAYIGYCSAKDKKIDAERREKTEARARLRERESRLSMEMMASNSELCDVICLAVTGGHTNGNVEAAQKKAKAARDAYYDFLKDTAAHDVAKV